MACIIIVVWDDIAWTTHILRGQQRASYAEGNAKNLGLPEVKCTDTQITLSLPRDIRPLVDLYLSYL